MNDRFEQRCASCGLWYRVRIRIFLYHIYATITAKCRLQGWSASFSLTSKAIHSQDVRYARLSTDDCRRGCVDSPFIKCVCVWAMCWQKFNYISDDRAREGESWHKIDSFLGGHWSANFLIILIHESSERLWPSWGFWWTLPCVILRKKILERKLKARHERWEYDERRLEKYCQQLSHCWNFFFAFYDAPCCAMRCHQCCRFKF